VTPVPIPNTEVKLLSADGSWDFVPVRVGRCQAQKAQPDKGCAFLYCSELQDSRINFDSLELEFYPIEGTKISFCFP
ncbi:MAG: hypothetical protein K0S80_477, partial [Neobacillus sp.]|nr:hypothetical protein [Neobacillus sp.]